jgi:outer membrane lipoprotein LolB
VLRAVPLAAALAVAGCVLPPAVAPGALNGRLSVQVDAHAERAAQSISASFELQGSAERGELRLSTTLGTTLATARWSPGQAWLVTPQGERRFEDLDALSIATFGEPLPLRALPDWLRGRPWPGAVAVVAAPPDKPGFEQLGWAIDLARFDAGQLLAQRAGPPRVRLRAQLEDSP